MAYEQKYMEYALSLDPERAEESPVGAAVVKKGRVIGAGRNRREREKNPLWHAEMEAIFAACRALGGWRLTGCDLYVTLEPCLMCAGAAGNSRIGQVYFGAYDPKEGACGSAVSALTRGGTFRPASGGATRSEVRKGQLSDFFERFEKKGRRVVYAASNIDYPDPPPLWPFPGNGVYGETDAGGTRPSPVFFQGYPMVGVQKGRVRGHGRHRHRGGNPDFGSSPELPGRKLGQGLPILGK
jgi:tRNA(adenine34) deaminase